MTTDPLDTEELRKARGAFFTPKVVSDYAVRWAVRSAADRVMEPSCGEAIFLLSSISRLRDLGATQPDVAGFEVHPESVRRAEAHMTLAGIPAGSVALGDFLLTDAAAAFDAVVGNPPYIRYQDFTGAAREAGRRAADAQGVTLTNLASSWAPFVVHSAAHLKPDGRLALVLPAELLSSNYAAAVRQYLMRRFARLRIVLFDDQVFPGVQTEALLLLAEGHGGTTEVEFGRVRDSSELNELAVFSRLRPASSGNKWTTALVNVSALETLTHLSSKGLEPMEAWGRISLGAVTGNNKFFTLSPTQVTDLGLTKNDVVALSPPGSSHLRQLSLTASKWTQLGAAGGKTHLFRPDRPSAAAHAYIKAGEASGINEAFKCRVRTPWWRVPLADKPVDLFVTYMNAETVQLCANPARLRHLNSVHGLSVTQEYKALASLLALSALNSATMLSAELIGRAYGGGILKLEPREAAQLSVPSPEMVLQIAPALRSAAPKVRAALQRSDLGSAVSLVDEAVLQHGLGTPLDAIHELRRSRNLLSHRRKQRARSATTTST